MAGYYWNVLRDKVNMQYDKSIDRVLAQATSLRDLTQIFAMLDELNRILHKFLPEYLTQYCHIGALDYEKNLIILYLNDSNIRHIIESMANLILANFNSHHFTFAGLITRIRPVVTTGNTRRAPKLAPPHIRNKLQQLAHSIGRIDLIQDVAITANIKEIDF